MSEPNYSALLRALSKEYCQGYISFGDYRERRKSILVDIDFEYNGVQEIIGVDDDGEQSSSADEEESLLGKVISLFKHDNESE